MRAHEHADLTTLAAEWKAEAENWTRRVGAGDRAVTTLTSCARDLEQALRDLSSRRTYLTVAQYAREHGRTASTVRRWCQAGALDAEQAGGAWRIPADARPDFARVRRATLQAVG
jgi:hypothetical protein